MDDYMNKLIDEVVANLLKERIGYNYYFTGIRCIKFSKQRFYQIKLVDPEKRVESQMQIADR